MIYGQGGDALRLLEGLEYLLALGWANSIRARVIRMAWNSTNNRS